MNIIFSIITFLMAFYCFVVGDVECMKYLMTAAMAFGGLYIFEGLIGHAKNTTSVMERRETP